MNKRVYNRTFGKIIRTLGFLLVTVSSIYLLTKLVLYETTLPLIKHLVRFAEIADRILTNVPLIDRYSPLAITLGFILLLWAIRRGIVLRVILTILLLFNLVLAGIGGLVPILISQPDWIYNLILKLPEAFWDLVLTNDYVAPGAFIATPFLLWVLFAYKKPKRVSTFLLRIGSIFMFLAVLLLGMTMFFDTLANSELFRAGYTGLYVLTYAMFIIGGAFGIIGFSRK